MSYTYEWISEEQTSLKRTDTEGRVAFLPADPTNSDYIEFLESGTEAAPYVAPPEPEPLSTEEKVNNMLAAFDLTREEMQAVLAAK